MAILKMSCVAAKQRVSYNNNIIIQLYFRRQPIIHIYKYKYSMVEYTQLNMYTFQL